MASVTVRPAPGQDPGTIAAAFGELINATAPAAAELHIKRWSSSRRWQTAQSPRSSRASRSRTAQIHAPNENLLARYIPLSIDTVKAPLVDLGKLEQILDNAHSAAISLAEAALSRFGFGSLEELHASSTEAIMSADRVYSAGGDELIDGGYGVGADPGRAGG